MVKWTELRPYLYKTLNLTFPISIYRKLDSKNNTWYFACDQLKIHDYRLTDPLEQLNTVEHLKTRAINLYRQYLEVLLKELN